MKYIIITIYHYYTLFIFTLIFIFLLFISFIWHLRITDTIKGCYNNLIDLYKSKIEYN